LVGLALWWIYGATQPAATGGAAAGGGARRGGHGGAGGMPTAVNGAKALVGDMPIYLNELGTATPPATVTVVAQISGQLQSIGFREGQMVKKGQFLAQIDPRPYQAALEQAQGVEAKDEALLANARIDLKRYQTLLTQDSVARQTVDTQAALVRQDEAQVKADKAAVDTQKLNLVYCHITAPISGRVGLRQVDVGNYVTANTTNGVVVITEVDPMDVLFTLPEDNLAIVAARMRSGAVLTAVAFDRAQLNQLAVGQLFTLDNQVDTTTGTVRAKARFNNADGALFPNQFINIRLTVDTLKNAVIVPTSAILKGPNGMFVYEVQPDRTVAVTNVKVGPAAGENTAILSGLDAGAVVVTDGSDRLKAGGRVILPGDCIPAGGRRHGGAAAGAGGATTKPKGGDGFFGLFAKKPAADPMAAMRCKPGQHPSSLLSGGGGGAFNLNFGAASTPPPAAAAPGAVTTTEVVHSLKTTSTAPADAAAAGPAPQAAQAPTVQTGGGGRMQAMISSLNLDPAQQVQAKAIFDAARQQAQASDDPSAMRGIMQGAFAKLAIILRPDQKPKLQQIQAEMAARRAQREAAGGGQSDQ
jgi:multidrug efflux system membrane fusion protein